MIIDETKASKIDDKQSGNSVGKTTVLNLIDFCFGEKPNKIWLDPETKKEEYLLIRNFLRENKVIISLLLSKDLDRPEAEKILIERNFLPRKETIRRINDISYTEEGFIDKLSSLIFPHHSTEKPTFRQIIAHNFRITDESLINTIRMLDKYSSDVEYEALHLFMLGITFDQSAEKQKLTNRLRQEELFKGRLEKNQTKGAYETTLSIIDSEIEELNEVKLNFNINPNFESDLNSLNHKKYEINKLSSEISKLAIRRDLILEAEQDLKGDLSQIDLDELSAIYEQANNHISSLQKTFEDLVVYHNSMVQEKVRFITKQLPEINAEIESKQRLLDVLLTDEKQISTKIVRSDSFEDLEKVIIQLNENYKRKGEYSNIIDQINAVDKEIEEIKEELDNIENSLFSEKFQTNLKAQVNKFNLKFSSISNDLYGERYGLKYDIITGKNGQKLYKFSSFNTNLSSGKKQGEISSFEIAYAIFADEEEIPTLHFILNDKKELMDDNQLVKISKLVENLNIQFVASILADKLPSELSKPEYIILKLSQQKKLFQVPG
ncbi:DUF2326 domain-containing protein [Dyadobacter sp. CY326]|uniref:DUF2326 domain-containing protein n=1 Tax=Dyadobacter sp. CY326 TaxID=2907300 RepID=UPI001F47B625|nr:DUF2326 domain-containing protein [Dyadobacter sp. CY326]MCE7067937.1 DUF2326 domain-containing protein [Dyadobacter sp. CY326]